jgi:predicted nucleotidyltransferase
MDRQEVIARLKATEPQIRALGVGALYLYGSHARNQARTDSDLDILVDFEPDRGNGLSAFMMPYRVLEDHFPGLTIGYGTRDSLVAEYLADIVQSAIRIF